MSHSKTVKKRLLSIIDEMDKVHWLFTKNPASDFSRTKKWSFSEMMKFIMAMEGKALKDELLEYFDFSKNTPSSASFNQRRAQILPEAFEFLFNEFTHVVSKPKLYQGYRLLACDGSDLNIAHNPNDEATYFQSLADSKGFNQIHLNALYDLRTKTYIDAIIQPSRKENEYKAMCDMVDRYDSENKTIFIADRGYENYNIFAHISEKHQFYLIRVKDLYSNGIVASAKTLLPKSKESFDETISITLTRKQTKEVKAAPEKYRIIMKVTPFDYLDLYDNKFYKMNMRIVRFPISENSYECIITNLPETEFPSEKIKELYHMRWGIETSFRELKYAVGLVNFHAKKLDYIKQEVWARIILYNFCEEITMHTIVKQSSRHRKHFYQLNYTRAIHICRYFLTIKREAPPDVEYLISKELLPVRLGRQDPRKVKVQTAISFLYRVA